MARGIKPTEAGFKVEKKYDDAMELLFDMSNSPDVTDDIRLKAARALLSYTHTKVPPKSGKQAAQEKAEESVNKFRPLSTPIQKVAK